MVYLMTGVSVTLVRWMGCRSSRRGRHGEVPPKTGAAGHGKRGGIIFLSPSGEIQGAMCRQSKESPRLKREMDREETQ